MIISMHFSRTPTPAAKRQSGMSIVELMISLTIGLMIVAALTTLFVKVSRTNQEMAKSNSQIENARFAMQFLQNDLIHAGHWGRHVPQWDDFSLDPTTSPDFAPTANPLACLAYTTPWSDQHIENLMAIPVSVYSGIPTGCGAVVTDKLANTDVLIVRHVSTCATTDAGCAADIAGELYFQSTNCDLQLDDDMDYVLGTPGTTMYQRDCIGTAGSPPVITAGTPAKKFKFEQNIFYIRNWAFTQTPSDGIPTLVRSSFNYNGVDLAQRAPDVLVPGIDRFRVEQAFDNVGDGGTNVIGDYGNSITWLDIDDRVDPSNRGDGVPEGDYIHCPTAATPCTVFDLANTVAVRIYILSRANEETPGYTDSKSYTLGGVAVTGLTGGFKRHVFSSSMRLVNVSGRRETP